MRTTNINQNGLGHVAVVFILLFVGVAGFAGYKVVANNKAPTTESSVTLSPKVPEKISTKADLVTTSKALDGASSGVNSGLNDDGLNADLNDLL